MLKKVTICSAFALALTFNATASEVQLTVPTMTEYIPGVAQQKIPQIKPTKSRGIIIHEMKFTENTLDKKTLNIGNKLIAHENTFSPNITIDNTLTKSTSKKKAKIILSQKKSMKVHENVVDFGDVRVIEREEVLAVLPKAYTKLTPEKLAKKAEYDNQINESIAALRFKTTAKERNDAVNTLIFNDSWEEAAKKLSKVESPDGRLNAIYILRKATLGTEDAFSSNVDSYSEQRAIPLLLKALTDTNAKVRFHAGLILTKITGKDAGFRYNAPISEREQAIIKWQELINKNNS